MEPGDRRLGELSKVLWKAFGWRAWSWGSAGHPGRMGGRQWQLFWTQGRM